MASTVEQNPLEAIEKFSHCKNYSVKESKLLKPIALLVLQSIYP
jgi:hypothetical protein